MLINKKLYGFNLRPFDQTNWFTLFQFWSQFWDVWTRPCLERIKLNGNCVRLIGDVSREARGLYTKSQYFEAWSQLAQWCRTNNVYLYPCLMGVGTDEVASWSQILDNVGELASYLVINYKDILIGIDLCNEAHSDSFPRPFTFSMYQELYNKVRLAINDSTIPLTFSEAVTAYNSPGPWTLSSLTSSLINNGLCDFIDLHLYGANPLSNAADNINAGYPNTPIIFGEFGIAHSSGIDAITNRISAIMSLTAKPFISGCLAWAIQDISWPEQFNYSGDTGFYSALGQPYNEFINPFIVGQVQENDVTSINFLFDGNKTDLFLDGTFDSTRQTSVFNGDIAKSMLTGKSWPITIGTIIDDDDPACSFTSGWTRWGNQGFHNSIREAFQGDGNQVATWVFAIVPGQYKIAATWNPYSNRATNAPYHLPDGTIVRVNQQQLPNDFQDVGVGWKNLGIVNAIGPTTLVVTLSNDANGNLNADAIRIEKIN